MAEIAEFDISKVKYEDLELPEPEQESEEINPEELFDDQECDFWQFPDEDDSIWRDEYENQIVSHRFVDDAYLRNLDLTAHSDDEMGDENEWDADAFPSDFVRHVRTVKDKSTEKRVSDIEAQLESIEALVQENAVLLEDAICQITTIEKHVKKIPKLMALMKQIDFKISQAFAIPSETEFEHPDPDYPEIA